MFLTCTANWVWCPRVCVCVVWTDTEEGERSSCVGWFHPREFVLSQPDWQPHWCRRCLLGFLQVALVRPWATIPCWWPPCPQLRAGLWDPHAQSCRPSGQVHPWGIQPWLQQEEQHTLRAVRTRSAAPLLHSWGLQTCLANKEIVSKGLALNLAGLYGDCHLLPRSHSPGTWINLQGEAAEPQGLGADVWTIWLWTFAFPFLPFSPHHLMPFFEAEEIPFPNKVLY